MSGKFYVGAGLLLGLLISCLLVGYGIKAIQDPVCQQVSTAIRKAESGDLTDAVETLKSAQHHWEDHRNALASFSNHNPMDDIDTLLAQTSSYGVSGLQEEFLAGCEQLLLLLNSISEDHRLTWWNLLSVGIFPASLP